jgi:predicted nuclease of predicted toxin-antitoxin system
MSMPWAKEHDHVIVSKDGDFRQLCILNGPPPKFVHLQIGNAGSREIIDLLKVKYSAIAEFGAAWQESVMILR